MLPKDFSYVVDAERLGPIAEEIAQASVVALDLETTGLDPYLAKIRLMSINTGRHVYVIDLFRTGTLDPVVVALRESKCVKVLHNAKFDQKFLLHHHGLELDPVFCTFRASVMIHNGREGMGHDLYTVMRRELNVQPQSLDLGGSDWSAPVLTEQQIHYAAEDVFWLPRVRESLRAQLLAHKLVQVATVEFRVILPEAAIELKGMGFNKKAWLALARENRAKEAVARAELMHLLPAPSNQLSLSCVGPSWNLNSGEQLRASLIKLGVHADDLMSQKRGEEAKPSVDVITLSMVAAQYPVIQKVLAWKKVARRVTGFGEEYLKHVHPVTGRIHANYYAMLKTGRYAPSDPNLSQLPRDKEFRACFTEEEEDGTNDYCYVVADYGNIEMRLAAGISKDPAMMRVFREGRDAHKYLAAILANCPESAVEKKQRQMAKPINFGLLYGMQPKLLVQYAQVGYGVTMSLDEAESFHALFFNKAYPGLKAWHRKALNEGKRDRFSRSVAGRVRYLDPHRHHNEFLNHPVQSTGADGLKNALRTLYERFRKYHGAVSLIHHVHDETLTRLPKDEELARLVKRDVEEGMKEGMYPFLKEVPIDVDGAVGSSWADKV